MSLAETAHTRALIGPKPGGLAALAALVAVALAASSFNGPRMVLVVAIGAFAGFALYHAAFGFTGAWKRIVTERRGHGLRAQMLQYQILVKLRYPNDFEYYHS